MTTRQESQQPNAAAKTIAFMAFMGARNHPESREEGMGPCSREVFDDGRLRITAYVHVPSVHIQIFRQDEVITVLDHRQGNTVEFQPGGWTRHLQQLEQATCQAMNEMEKNGEWERHRQARFAPLDDSDIFPEAGQG